MKTSLRTTSLVLTALILGSLLFASEPGPKSKHLGIQLYSVKSIDSDLEGALKSLQQDGYKVIEIANYVTEERKVEGLSPVAFTALAEKYGMDIISSHARGKFDANDVAGSLEEWGMIFDDHKAMGCKYVVLPSNRWADNPEELIVQCDLMNKIGEEASKRGIKFGYHNHNMEFEKVSGTDQLLEDFLIANTDPEKVFFQLDVYWITVGGQDPVTYMKKYPDRIKLLHIKDDYVIGESGKIDYAPIFKQFYKNGGEDWFVELEQYMTDEQRAEMRARMEEMRKRQSESGQAGQGGERPRWTPPKRTPEENAELLKTSLEGISKSAAYLNSAKFVK